MFNQNGKLRRIVHELLKGNENWSPREGGQGLRNIMDCMISEIESRLPPIPPGVLKSCVTCANVLADGDVYRCLRAFDVVTGAALQCRAAREGGGVLWYAPDATPCNSIGRHWIPIQAAAVKPAGACEA